MVQSSLLYVLPFLHTALADGSMPATGALRLWPGLPDMPSTGYWSAPEYPFAPPRAQECMQQLEALSEAALSGVPMQTLASMDSAPEAQKRRKELDDIAAFANSGASPSPKGPEAVRVMQAAQKALLWAWLLEEKVLEVKKIMGTYVQDAPHVMDALGVEADDDDTVLSLLASLDRSLDNTTVMLPPWLMVLENAALFLPDQAFIGVEGGMADELYDRLTFMPASVSTRTLCGVGANGDNNAEDTLFEARAPLWQALGKGEENSEHPWRNKIFTFVLVKPEHRVTA
ncbi:MAG: hypothetical protein RRY29_11320 [Desulfovibrionaceae bacterium]